MKKTISNPDDASKLRRLAELQYKARRKHPTLSRTEADTARINHELEVHQIELEMQNAELQEASDKVETLLETYTDLYDFAPVGYFSVDEQGIILEVNLTGAALLGIERSLLVNRRLQGFVDPPSRRDLPAFLKKIFASAGKHICEIPLLNERGLPFWADIQATSADSRKGSRKWCRMAISDLTKLKHDEEVRLRLEALSDANRELKLENAQRQKAELALKNSEAQLRHLSRQLLVAHEDERKRISRELHDEIVQTLVGINVHLAALLVKTPANLKDLRKHIARTQQLVEKSVEIVHRFARELRPNVLDDLGLVPALNSYIKDFTKRTGLCVHFKAIAGVEELDSDQRTVLYRIAQSALTNVHKHARATEATVSIRKLPGAIQMEIHDNGKSFQVEKVLFAKRHKRLGLLGSRERVEMIGGKFGVNSSPGKGTTISAEIPIKGNEPKSSPKTFGKITGRVK
jgi:PAS domain S-box-containing protein